MNRTEILAALKRGRRRLEAHTEALRAIAPPSEPSEVEEITPDGMRNGAGRRVTEELRVSSLKLSVLFQKT